MTEDLETRERAPTLFDGGTRTDMDGAGYGDRQFDFLNRSAWGCMELARATIDSWFANIPSNNRADIRNRFRGDDRSHASVLLEMATHEILRATCTSVRVGPDLYGGNPDFSAHYRGTNFIVECTVTQGSDEEFASSQREDSLRDIVNGVDAGPFTLSWETLVAGTEQPSGRRLRNHLGQWLSLLNPDEESTRSQNSLEWPTIVWEERGWRILFSAIYVGTESRRAIGIIDEPAQWLTDDEPVLRSLETKAGRYGPQVPYLIVISQRDSLHGNEVMFDALLGRERWLQTEAGFVEGPRHFDGLWGSPSQPRNRHVSAVLFKRSIRNVWDVCAQVIENGGVKPSWHLMHNPEAHRRLPRGMFPFAAEYAVEGTSFQVARPSMSLNDFLGLPDPWPGEEH